MRPPWPLAELGDLASSHATQSVYLFGSLPFFVGHDGSGFAVGHRQREFQNESRRPAAIGDFGKEAVFVGLKELLHVDLDRLFPRAAADDVLSVNNNRHLIVAGGLESGRR